MTVCGSFASLRVGKEPGEGLLSDIGAATLLSDIGAATLLSDIGCGILV